MVVVGAGVIGIEYASMFAALKAARAAEREADQAARAARLQGAIALAAHDSPADVQRRAGPGR